MLDDLSDDMRRKLEALEMKQRRPGPDDIPVKNPDREILQASPAALAKEERAKLWEVYVALAPASYRCDSSLTDEREALTCMELAKVFLAVWKAETEAPAVEIEDCPRCARFGNDADNPLKHSPADCPRRQEP